MDSEESRPHSQRVQADGEIDWKSLRIFHAFLTPCKILSPSSLSSVACSQLLVLSPCHSMVSIFNHEVACKRFVIHFSCKGSYILHFLFTSVKGLVNFCIYDMVVALICPRLRVFTVQVLEFSLCVKSNTSVLYKLLVFCPVVCKRTN